MSSLNDPYSSRNLNFRHSRPHDAEDIRIFRMTRSKEKIPIQTSDSEVQTIIASAFLKAEKEDKPPITKSLTTISTFENEPVNTGVEDYIKELEHRVQKIEEENAKGEKLTNAEIELEKLRKKRMEHKKQLKEIERQYYEYLKKTHKRKEPNKDFKSGFSDFLVSLKLIDDDQLFNNDEKLYKNDEQLIKNDDPLFKNDLFKNEDIWSIYDVPGELKDRRSSLPSKKSIFDSVKSDFPRKIKTAWDDPIPFKEIINVNTFSKKPKITIPVPFSFSNRDSMKKKTIAQKKFEEDLLKKKKEEEYHLNKRFKANPVPYSTLLPRYEQLKREREMRSRQIREESKQLTKENERPFSFYKRDMEKKKEKELQRMMAHVVPTSFKYARPVPEFVKTNIMDELQKKEEERQKRIAERANELLKSASLPPRMKMHAETEKETKKVKEKEFTFRPKIKPEVPPFSKLQKQFLEELARKKKLRKPTEPQEFKLHKSEPRIDKIIQDIINDECTLPETRWPHKSKRIVEKYKPIPPPESPIEPVMTKSFIKRNEKIRERIREREARIEQLKQKEEEYKRKQEEINRKYRAHLPKDTAKQDAEKKQEEIRKQRKISEEQMKEDFDNLVRRREEKLKNKPLLLEQDYVEKLEKDVLGYVLGDLTT